MKDTVRGALVGAGIGLVPVTMALAWADHENPWFLDHLGIALLLAAPSMALAGLCGAWRRWSWGGPVPLAIQVFVLVLLSRSPVGTAKSTRLFIMGIDGAGWSLLDGLELPAIEALQARGTRAVLNSREPMFSPLLWTTMASGRVPEEHGIQGFRTQADHCTAARFWDIAWTKDLSVGLYKWLVTWPPPDGGPGFVVPAWLAAEPDTRPEELRFIKELELSRRIKRKNIQGARPAWKLGLLGIPHGLRLSTLSLAASEMVREAWLRPKAEERAWRLQILRTRMDRDVFITQLARHDPDVATFTTYATDALGHTHFGAMVEGGPWKEALPDAYRQADSILAEVLTQLGPQVTVLVVSDHGFRAMEANDAARYFAPRTERLRARASEAVGKVDVAKVGHKLTVLLEGEDKAAQRAALEAWLPSLVQASTGEPFYRWEAVPENEHAVGLTLRDERIDADRLASDSVGGEPLSEYATLTDAYTGEHDKAGILVATGPTIPTGARLPDVELLDVAPTILGILGIPAARDMPGRVLFGEDLPRVESYDSLAPATGQEKTEEALVNEEQLKALGYVE